MHAAEEGHHVVLAEAVEVDVAHQHHLVVVDVEQRTRQDLARILRVALREEAQRLGRTRWCSRETFAAGIFSQLLQQSLHQPRYVVGCLRIDVFDHLFSPTSK